MMAYKKAGYSWDSCMCVARIFLSKNIYLHSGWDRRQADAEHWQCQGIGTDYLWFSPTCWEHQYFVFCITEVYLYSWYIIGTSYLWLSNMSHIRNNIDRCMDGQIQIHMQTRAAKIQPQLHQQWFVSFARIAQTIGERSNDHDKKTQGMAKVETHLFSMFLTGQRTTQEVVNETYITLVFDSLFFEKLMAAQTLCITLVSERTGGNRSQR